MGRAEARDEARLKISREAARLFLERGVADTSGDDISAAAGVSTRTVWRYFRSKESCVEPLFLLSTQRFADVLHKWPRDMAIEELVHSSFGPGNQPDEHIADDVMVARLIARLPDEPALRTAWLMSCQIGEERLLSIIADRLDLSPNDFDVRLCAATVMAAIRVIDETISRAAIKYGQKFKLEEINEQLAQAIRKASTLPICDPVTPRVWSKAAAPDR